MAPFTTTPGSSAAAGLRGSLIIGVALLGLVLTVSEVASRYVPNTWVQRDGRFYTNISATLAESGSVDQGEFCASWYEDTMGWNRNLDAAWSNTALGADGRRLPKHPILFPLLSTPLYWSLGLLGNLLFNMLMIGVAIGAAFAFARHYTSDLGAAFAAIGLPFATGIRLYTYDYHVDVLMLALFLGACASALSRRGLIAGALVGAMVVLRPTGLLWLPSLALLLIARRDYRTLLRALLAGTTVLGLFALSNDWLYGRPWWTGYNRILVMVDGEAEVADVQGAFSVPLKEGLKSLWSGPNGISKQLSLLALALPGLILMLRRQRAYVIACLLALALSIPLFAKYQWYGDRFLWPSAALLMPALATSVAVLGRRLGGLPAGRGWRPILAVFAGAVFFIVARAIPGAPLEARIADGSLQALLLGALLSGVAASGLYLAAFRAGLGAASPVVGFAFIVLPTMLGRLSSPSYDLAVAAALFWAFGVRRAWFSLFLASLMAALVLQAGAERELSGGLSIGLSNLWSGLSHGTGRGVAVLIAANALMLPWAGRRLRFYLPLLTLAMPMVASLGEGRWPLFSMGLLLVPLSALSMSLADRIRRSYRDHGRLGRVLWVLAPLALTLCIGGARRAVAHHRNTHRLASPASVRRAEVTLGTYRCDFLNWTHYNWECAGFDRGIRGQVGLHTTAPMHVAGIVSNALYIVTPSSRSRAVSWPDTAMGPSLDLTYAIPDEGRGGGTLVVSLNETEVAEIELPPHADREQHHAQIDTSEFVGQRPRLTLELRGPGTSVLVDAVVEGP